MWSYKLNLDSVGKLTTNFLISVLESDALSGIVSWLIRQMLRDVQTHILEEVGAIAYKLILVTVKMLTLDFSISVSGVRPAEDCLVAIWKSVNWNTCQTQLLGVKDGPILACSWYLWKSRPQVTIFSCC
jgi:hypothetical protein